MIITLITITLSAKVICAHFLTVHSSWIHCYTGLLLTQFNRHRRHHSLRRLREEVIARNGVQATWSWSLPARVIVQNGCSSLATSCLDLYFFHARGFFREATIGRFSHKGVSYHRASQVAANGTDFPCTLQIIKQLDSKDSLWNLLEIMFCEKHERIAAG